MRTVVDTEGPRGLSEPRPGYFMYTSPTGEKTAIGRVPAAAARAEAEAANAYFAARKPGLVARLSGTAQTVDMLLAKMPVPTNTNTAKQRRAQDKIIREALGSITCVALTVADCAAVVEGINDAGKATMASAVRSRLISVCRRGMQLGWMPSNPAEVTARPKVVVRRGRLTLEMFMAIYARAPEVAGYLRPAMRLALITGADRSTLARLTKSNVQDGHLTFQRPKTKRWIKVPLALHMDAAGWSLAGVVQSDTGVLSPHLIHHTEDFINTPIGSKVHVDSITNAFTAARRLAGIPDVLPNGDEAPTFHEMRSLAKREYLKQGGVDTLALLGHADEKTGDTYADGRGIEPVMVKVA